MMNDLWFICLLMLLNTSIYLFTLFSMKKSTQKMRWITFALWPIWIGITWFLSSLIFWILNEYQWWMTVLMDDIKLFIYYSLGLLLFLSIIFVPIGIYMWVKSKRKEEAKIWDDLMMDPIRFWWKAMKKYFWFWVLLLIIFYGVTQGYGRRVQSEIPYDALWFVRTRDILISFVLLQLVGMLISIFFSIPIIVSSLRAVDGVTMSWRKAFSKLDFLWSLFVWGILYMLIVAGWMILFIIPWIFRSVRFQFWGFFVVDKWYGPIEALKASRRITKDHFRDIFVFNFLIGGVVLLWALAFLIWLFAALPTMYIAQAKLYRILKDKADKSDEAIK